MGADRKLQFRSLTRMYLYIIQLLKLRRCTLSLFTVVLAVLAPAQQSAGLGKPFFTGSHHMRRSARFLPCDTISWDFFRCGTWQMSRSSSHTVSFPRGRTPPQESGGVCVTSTNKHRAENCTIGLFGALLTQQEYIYRSYTLSLIDATLYFIKSSFKAAPQGITW